SKGDPLPSRGGGQPPHGGGPRRICTDTTDECHVVEWTENVKFTTLWVAFGRSCQLPLVPQHPLAGYGVLAGLDNVAPYGGDTRFEVENHFVADPAADNYFADGVPGWAWQKFRDFQHMFDMCYNDLIGPFAPLRDTYFQSNYEANQALIKAGNVGAVQAFDQKALDDALTLMNNFQKNNMVVAELTSAPFDIAGGSGNVNHTIQIKMPSGVVPSTVFYKWGGRGSFAAGSALTAVTGQSDLYQATLSLSRGNTAFAGKYDIAIGGRTSDGKGWCGLLVIDAYNNTNTQLIYKVAPEDQKGVIGRVPIDNSSGGRAAWRALNYSATVRANNASGEIISGAGRARQDGFLRKEGYELIGWKSDIPGDDKVYVAGDRITLSQPNRVILTAVWEKAATGVLAVKYIYIPDEDGDEEFYTIGELPVDSNLYNPGDTVTVKGIGTFEKFDHTFDYWIDPVNPNEKIYAGDTIIIGEQNITLIAHFYYCGCDTPESITYLANGATGSVPFDDGLYAPNTNVILLGQGSLSKGSQDFLGWTVRRTGVTDVDAYGFILDGQGNRKIFMPGETVAMKGTGLTAIAQWSGGPGPDDKVPGEDDEEGAKISVTNAKGMHGDTVSVYITLADNPGLAGLQLAISYDETALKLVSVTKASALESMLFTGIKDPAPNPFTVLWASQSNDNSNGDILKLEFAILDSAKTGIYPVEISYIAENTIDEDFEPVPVITKNGHITVFTIGDVNVDGRITVADAILVLRYINDWVLAPGSFEVSAADVDGDGEITINDAILILQYVNGWITKFPGQQ
ncbi:MAG: cohesin domain-containing protein, partial [Clostridiales bacterium]|nr:cohesin domain-containing protein [Clostridiales bacterium]